MKTDLCSNGFYVLEDLKLTHDDPGSLIRGWGNAFVNMPEKIPFLDNETVAGLCTYLKIDEDACKVIREVLPVIQNNASLKAYIWYFYYRLATPSFSYGCGPTGFGDYPLPEYHLGKNKYCVFLFAAFGVVLDAQRNYRAQGVPENMIRDTLSVVGESVRTFRYHTGCTGLSEPVFCWLRLYVTGCLLQLGRFNFKLMETNPFGVVLKNKNDGCKVMLMEPGVKLNSKGYYLREKEVFGKPYTDPHGEDFFVSEYEKRADGWYGNPVHPYGYVLREKRFFPKAEWELIIEPGDVMIDMHIPAGGGMTPERCIDSFRQAFQYFKKRYNGKFKPVIICHSWIFNTQFEERLPDSNLAKLMRECYLFPFQSCGQDGIYFVFGKYFRPEEVADAPRDTSLRRTMLDLAQTPEQLRCGGMLFFEDELESFGIQSYRKNFKI